jgi:uncharacterized protein (TIGR03032 family)
LSIAGGIERCKKIGSSGTGKAEFRDFFRNHVTVVPLDAFLIDPSAVNALPCGRAALVYQVPQPKEFAMSQIKPSTVATSAPAEMTPAPLRSVYTENFPASLDALNASLMVTTYQAGKLVMVRADNGVLNTHFRSFNVPMGLALSGDRLAVGTDLEIWEFHDSPAVAAKLDPAGKHDACFLPRRSQTTGNIQIHEMAWGHARGQGSVIRGQESGVLTPDSCLLTPELWFVNTRFSCLCTRDDRYSFVPRWRPPFISGLAPEDRCHLNGLAMVDGRPRFLTALGVSDEPRGWRPHKRDGGVLFDLPSGEIICRGLSMPHSPRFHDGRLWVLNSGVGGLGTVDLNTGRYEEVAALPGFTRGLDFLGRYAFIGLSQVRESAIFSGIAIADRPIEERCCGVYVVDIVTGKIVAFVKFEDRLQEIFAVQVVVGRRFPDVINDDRARIADSFVVPEEPLCCAAA